MESVDQRLKNLSKFTQEMTEIRISRHPGKKDCMFLIMNKDNDQYGDAYTEEVCRLYKQVILRLNTSLEFVQEFEDILSEQDQEPYVLVLTKVGLPRIPRANDRALIDGVLYNILAVRPTNRNTQVVFECLVLPDRTDIDPLQIKDVRLFLDGEEKHIKDLTDTTVRYEIIYGGAPTEIAFTKDVWVPFKVTGKVYIKDCLQVWLRDKEGTTIYYSKNHVN